ncbi:HNH endonuclease domain-containing protein [Ramlibacter sp. MMS24-I3-19]|uniref:HNH endonuclease domain-containing protein n=1 Tax=Ramlibacter sp. MMS24-I3-19 TaxID=3416606 RepID=UPI003D046173
MFHDTTNSYKIVWFLALLRLVKETRGRSARFTLAEAFVEAAVLAWPAACLYLLSFGKQDQLATWLRTTIDRLGVPAAAGPNAVRTTLRESGTLSELQKFERYVPTRFLTPWFRESLRGTPDHARDALIRDLAFRARSTSEAPPYFLDGDVIEVTPPWMHFLSENMPLVEAFAEHAFVEFLQSKNPSVPGIVNKTKPPIRRNLKTARDAWTQVRSCMESAGCGNEFRDIYSGEQLAEFFAIDHVLPWTFVAHDLLWNLTPVSVSTNSSKSDCLPDLEIYIPRLAKLHLRAIRLVPGSVIVDDYEQHFKVPRPELLALSDERFLQECRASLTPLAHIARQQGFSADWQVRSGAQDLDLS